MTKTHAVVEALTAELIGSKITIRGWIRTRRGSGSFSFLEVNDGSCMSNLQVIADQELPNYESEIGHLTTGCSVTVEGEIKDSPGKQPTEMHASKIVVHGWAKDYPLQKKRHSFEKLREWAHLRARTNTFGAAARVRNQVSMSIHNAFQEEGFLYLHTPIITASDCEGAGEMFRVAKLDLDGRKAIQAVQDGSLDFFDRPSYLTVSGQLEAEIYATALSKVYTFGPTFRAENSNTSRHLSEFWMVEPEVAFYELTDNMDLAERFLKRLFRDALEKSAEDMRFFADQNIRIAAQKTKDKQQNKNQTHPFVGVDVISRLAQIIDSEFVRLPYTEAIEILTSSGQEFEFPVEWGVDLQSEHERYLTETKFGRPVIVYDYPATIKPFYMRVNDGGKTVRAMDVLVPGVGEIIGGSQREERLDVIEERMQTQGLKVDDYWWYTDLRRYGTVPHAGFGLGLERVIQFITGLANIRDVIPFPRTPGTAEF